MKTLILILVLITSIFSASNSCCLTSKLDSLKGIASYKWGAYPYTVLFYPQLDSSNNKNSCDTFNFTVRRYKQGEDMTYTHVYQRLTANSYRKFIEANNNLNRTQYILSTDTVRNYCTPVSTEESSNITEEKLLSVKVYTIDGKLVSDDKSLNINRLHGFYLFRYVTDKRIYTVKRIYLR